MNITSDQNKLPKLLLSLFLLMALSACSTGIDVNYQTRFSFSQVERYSLFDRNSAFSDHQNINDITRNSIEIAIERTLDKQGFIYSELEQADINVSYFIIGKSPENFEKYNKSVLYCQHCLIANTWKTTKENWRLSPGALILDLVDPITKRSVWRSYYPLKIKVSDNSQVVNEKIQQAVNRMLANYP